jgi:hypothetical protein
MSRIVDGLAKAGLKLQPCPPLAALGNKVR